MPSDEFERDGGDGESESGVVAAGAGALRLAWRTIVAVVGATVVLIGAVLIVTPGPALLVIPVGLAILATEFAWARRWLRRLKSDE